MHEILYHIFGLRKGDDIMWRNFLDTLLSGAFEFGVRLILAILLLVVGLKIANFLIKRIAKGKGFSKLDVSVQSFFKSGMSVLFKTLVVVSAAIMLGLPATAFITALASCGVAIGLALQGSLSNFAGGIMILIFKPFKVGDYIEAQGYEGTVKNISIFYTTLTTFDNKGVTLPNGTLTNNPMRNFTAEDTRRVDLEFSVAYGSDIELVKGVLLEQAAKNTMVLDNPEPFACLLRQEASALVFQLRVWCNTPDYWSVHFELQEAVKKALEHQNICVPYNQMDIHIKAE